MPWWNVMSRCRCWGRLRCHQSQQFLNLGLNCKLKLQQLQPVCELAAPAFEDHVLIRGLRIKFWCCRTYMFQDFPAVFFCFYPVFGIWFSHHAESYIRWNADSSGPREHSLLAFESYALIVLRSMKERHNSTTVLDLQIFQLHRDKVSSDIGQLSRIHMAGVSVFLWYLLFCTLLAINLN